MDAIQLQKQKLDTMYLDETDLKLLSQSRTQVGILCGGGLMAGGLGGYLMTNGNGSSLRLRAFTIVSTLLAGGCLGAALGIQTALQTISKHPGNLGKEVLIYQGLMERSRRAHGRLTVGDEEDKEFEARMIRDILPQRSRQPSLD